jgi:hypothetical protein
MLAADLPVWLRFQERFGNVFERFYFDVLVGGPDWETIKHDPAIAKMWWQLKAKKIDVLAEKKDEIWICEIASRPGIRAIGQLTTYRTLWALDPKIDKPAQCYLICDWCDSDLEFTAMVSGIRILLV